MGSLSLETAGASPLLQNCLSSNFTVWQTLIVSVLQEAIERSDLPKSARPEALAAWKWLPSIAGEGALLALSGR